METNAPLALWVARMLASGFYASIISVSDTSLLSGRQRLEKFLLEMAEPILGRNGKKEIKLPILLKQWEMAQLLSLTPQHLARLVKQIGRRRDPREEKRVADPSRPGETAAPGHESVADSSGIITPYGNDPPRPRALRLNMGSCRRCRM